MMLRLAAFGVLLVSAAVAQAGPLVPAHVPADAKWVLHVNVEAVRSSDLVAPLRKKWIESDKYEAMVKRVTDKLGINPAEDLLGVTVFNTNYDRHQGVALVYFKKLDREKMVEVFKEKEPDHETATHGDRTLYTWTAHKGRGHDHPITGTFVSDSVVLIGADAKRVKAALAVIDGSQESLGKEAGLIQGFSDNALLAARAVDVPDAVRKAARDPFMSNLTAATVVWTEREGQLSGRYELETVSEDAAQNFAAIVDGFKALVGLRLGYEENVSKLLDGLSAKADGDTLNVAFEGPVENIHALAKKQMERFKHRRHRHKKGDDEKDEKERKGGEGKRDATKEEK